MLNKKSKDGESMAENNAPQTPHLNFARLDDEDRDYDAPSVSDEGRGGGGGHI